MFGGRVNVVEKSTVSFFSYKTVKTETTVSSGRLVTIYKPRGVTFQLILFLIALQKNPENTKASRGYKVFPAPVRILCPLRIPTVQPIAYSI
jgi:hypothetical protein